MLPRRKFVTLTVAGAGGGAITLLYSTRQPSESGLVSGSPILNLLNNLPPMDDLGEAWLLGLHSPPDLAALAANLQVILGSERAVIEQRLAEQIQQDFAGDSLCEVDGWRLSQTECELAGLQYLARESGQLEPLVHGQSREAEYASGHIATVTKWGPRSTQVGRPFNLQLDGHSGFWFRVNGPPSHARIMIDGKLAKTSVSEKSMSSGLWGEERERMLSQPGRYEIALVDPIRKLKQFIGHFEVKPDPASRAQKAGTQEVLCPITKWGPRKTRVGVAVNERPDGSIGMWFHTECLPRGVKLYFGEDPLKITRGRAGFTAALPLALVGSPGRIPLRLQNPKGGDSLLIGHLVINE